LLVGELEGRLTILDRDYQVITHLGDNPDAEERAHRDVPPARWRDGVFVAPHAAAWDHEGNLYVAEWSAFGRLCKLRHVRAA
jgi:hypothetical protein